MMYRFIIHVFVIIIKIFKIVLKSKDDLVLENLVLRQQLGLFKAKKVKANLTEIDRTFWVALKQAWSKWIDVLVIVKPETVIDWQNRRFKKYWHKKSSKNRKPGRKPTIKEIRELIYRMYMENNWGAPTIYSELRMLGFGNDVSQSTVSRYLRKIKKDDPNTVKKRRSWSTFLKNHRDFIAAMDFFVIPTVQFRIFYVFFVISHARRQVVHFNVTEHPTAQWVIRQLREAFPFDQAPKYLICDRDKIFSSRVKEFVKNMGIKPKIISYQSPWQNGVAERYVLSVRSEILNHVIILNERHLNRLMRSYAEYYNNDRCHLSVGRDSPNGRDVQTKPLGSTKVISVPKLGGLRHKYIWKKAA